MYDHEVKDVTAFVLAGGKSTRMGRDKAFLHWAGGTLLSNALKVAASVTANVVIVGDTQKFSCAGVVVEDAYRDRGPLGGIHAALSHSTTDLNLMLAVDLPFVQAPFLAYLIRQARESQAMITVPRASGGFHPLCAVYRKEFVTLAEQSLRERKNKIDSLFPKVACRILEEDELRKAGFSPEIFRNLNTPEELERAKGEHPL